jgi:hypothetical protein
VKWLRGRIQRDERGASLILAIAFMLVAGAIGAGVTTAVSSGLNDSSALAVARDREYAAEGAIDYAIVHVRATTPASSIGLTRCGPFTKSNVSELGSMPLRGSQTVDIRVDCVPAPELTADLSARNNVILSACVDTGQQQCDPAKVLIRAQINFQVSGSPPEVSKVDRTYVQTWSVNG